MYGLVLSLAYGKASVSIGARVTVRGRVCVRERAGVRAELGGQGLVSE